VVGLAAARRPEQAEELAARHVEVDPVHRDDVVEPLDQSGELDPSPRHRQRRVTT
jgi:hypothetical protein